MLWETQTISQKTKAEGVHDTASSVAMSPLFLWLHTIFQIKKHSVRLSIPLDKSTVSTTGYYAIYSRKKEFIRIV